MQHSGVAPFSSSLNDIPIRVHPCKCTLFHKPLTENQNRLFQVHGKMRINEQIFDRMKSLRCQFAQVDTSDWSRRKIPNKFSNGVKVIRKLYEQIVPETTTERNDSLITIFLVVDVFSESPMICNLRCTFIVLLLCRSTNDDS